MSCDLFALNALANELNSALEGGRVDKITQPEVDEVRFFVCSKGKNQCLVVSCNSQAPRLHITQNKKQNPVNAPSLCMLLRKHLVGSKLDNIKIFGQDRTICLSFTGKTEMQDIAQYKIYVELMNRYSNIVFTDSKNIILDSAKRLPLDEGREHAIFRGLLYEPVKQPKTCVFSAQKSDFENFSGGSLEDYIMSTFSGFSRITAKEFVAKAKLYENIATPFDDHKKSISESLDEQIKKISKPSQIQTKINLEEQEKTLSEAQVKKVVELLSIFENITKTNDYSPCIIGSEVYPFPYTTLLAKEKQKSELRTFATMSEAFDVQYGNLDNEVRVKAKIKHLATATKRIRERTQRHTNSNLEKLAECENMDLLRLYGELIVSNIYKIKRGDKSVTVENYYNGEKLEILLDEKLTPAQNSNAYYSRYNKLKRTQEFLEKKTFEDKILLSYISTIEDSIAQIKLNDNIEEIENELKAIGAITTKKEKKSTKRADKHAKAQPPIQYEYEGFTILKGKNNIQNDNLTFKIASTHDIWLHLKNEHGTHCIILCEGKKPQQDVIKFAAEITASSESASIEVDFTERKNVKRMPQGHPGQVTYTDFKTIIVEPNEHCDFLV